MGKIALVFAGQGAQHPGMGKEIQIKSKAASEVFERAEKVRDGTVRQCFEADQKELSETKNTQPCVYTVDLVMAAALEEAGIKADMVAGYSLGELAALAYAGAFSYEDGLRLVSKRGALMQTASEKQDTGMMAVLKLEDDVIEEVCGRYDQVYPVNFNCRGQVTVAGDKKELEGFKEDIKAKGGLIRILEVSGGFHSPFMAEAAEEFAEILKGVTIEKPKIPVYSNWTAMPYDGDGRQYLAKQIISPIRWKVAIENMIEAGADTFIEVGPGTALTKMITRISKKINMYNVKDMQSLELTLKGVKDNG